MGPCADGLAQKSKGRIFFAERAVRPFCIEGFGLRRFRLVRCNEKRRFGSHMDRNVLAASGPTDGIGKAGSLFRFAADGGNAKQIALRLFEQVGKRDRIDPSFRE